MDSRLRTRLLVAATVAALVAAATAAAAAAPVVSVRLAGSNGTASLLCGAGNRNTYAVVRRGGTVVVSGVVSPKPRAGWHVVVEVRRCVADRFTLGWKRQVAGGLKRTFRVAYVARSAGTYFVRVDYGRHPTVESAKQRYVVR